MQRWRVTLTINFLRFLAAHGIDPDVPLIVVTVLTITMFQFTLNEWRNYLLEKKNLRRISIVVTAQTEWHLKHLAAISGYSEKNLGKVVDKLVRLFCAVKKEQHHD